MTSSSPKKPNFPAAKLDVGYSRRQRTRTTLTQAPPQYPSLPTYPFILSFLSLFGSSRFRCRLENNHRSHASTRLEYRSSLPLPPHNATGKTLYPYRGKSNVFRRTRPKVGVYLYRVYDTSRYYIPVAKFAVFDS